MRQSFIRIATVTVLALTCGSIAHAQQTIVFFRHGEKPSGGLGQLTCQGLNRALALPDVLIGKFGMPDYLYAPNPAVKISDPAGSYFYVRPLATIEPTAIRAGKSVNTNYGYNNISGIHGVLIRETKANTTIFVSWEHDYLVRIVRHLMSLYGDGQTVPSWTSGDYDSLYILRVDYSGSSIRARFERDREYLNGLSTTCP